MEVDEGNKVWRIVSSGDSSEEKSDDDDDGDDGQLQVGDDDSFDQGVIVSPTHTHLLLSLSFKGLPNPVFNPSKYFKRVFRVRVAYEPAGQAITSPPYVIEVT